MVDEAPKSETVTVEELRAALLHVVAAVNDIDSALKQFSYSLRMATRDQRGFGPYQIREVVTRLESRLRGAQPRLREAVDILVKEGDVENG
jgi:hypothetical protein